MKQAIDVVRIQLVNWPTRLGAPLGILVVVFTINYAIFASIADVTPPEARTTGGILSIYITAGISYLQCMTRGFPFALGLSVTRRAFYAGIALLAATEAAVYGAVLVVLDLVEEATGGWGMNLQFFGLGFLHGDNVLAQWAIYAAPFMVIIAAGVFAGVVFKRWGQPEVYLLSIAAALLVGGLAVLISVRAWWPAVGSWLGDQPPVALFGGYPLVLAALLGGAGWLTIRRATP
jgi:hypothetical protein